MKRKSLVLAIGLFLFPVVFLAQEKPTIVINVFTVASSVALPYDMKGVQMQTLAEVKAKFAKEFVDVLGEAPPKTAAEVYTVDGEVVEWKPGNAAKRAVVGFGAGRESAKLHLWITDKTGKKIVERTESVKAEFFGGAFQGSVGQLAHPFADKIGDRIKEAKIVKKPKG